MTSWVYVFSRFTPEALLFEILLISILIAGYAAFWVLYKRKYGAASADGVVKTYMNELIRDAEKLRAQLFGMINGTEPNAYPPTASAGTEAPIQNFNVDAALAKNIAVMEQKLTQQAAAMEAVVAEKARLESELVSAQSQAATAVPAAAGDSAAFSDLQSKLKTLEDKLAEYSVIEDDLANLKRLQQENAQLKAALGGQVPVEAAPAKPAEPVAAVVTGQSETVDQAAIDALFDSPPAAETKPAEPAAVEIAAPVAEVATPAVEAVAESATAASTATTNDPLFEGLVDQVETSLKAEPAAGASVSPDPVPEAPTPAPVQTAPASSTSTSKPAAAKIEKSDADLVAEFEKMLNG
ncbi:MAG: hypothetical protein A2Z97_08680 [Bdellovibrionales bacterium GWB1_52_6]|nr:MAG: hypothetical protein A2Z97_08680 [Bdellovibrionales bacterium GWB1_52_6]OFZ03079.1 MAG: hypothetical protein A2X97_09580 [Bdellovibrionales bacterium GWA1_52_35]